MSTNTSTEQSYGVAERLRMHPSIRRNQKLVVEQQDKRIILNGSVPSYYDKQVVQELIRHLDGVDEVINQLLVTGEFEDA